MSAKAWTAVAAECPGVGKGENGRRNELRGWLIENVPNLQEIETQPDGTQVVILKRGVRLVLDFGSPVR